MIVFLHLTLIVGQLQYLNNTKLEKLDLHFGFGILCVSKAETT